ncbi:ATP-dependent DNA helicase RecG [Desulfuromonas sp. AOP6]|uniref:ATP-dependent DNA helicase RecG n=1 Tax=Desulfuromonas sp. AOP6 TaxID=1566351 RepID=UPI00127B1DD8|nr:ATP-dependent DNA helicase RecG [Desulfuromonas sp. AOP6]BCA79757.1 ATP-dependent DNA helicase RecG [Desulfuromonas sp. AOP6]
MPPLLSYQSSRHILSTPLEQIRGVGPRLLEKLRQMGISSLEDALYTLPYRYEDRREIRKIACLRAGRSEVFYGEILAASETQTPRTRKKIFEVIVSDGSGQISLKWFRYQRNWIKNRFSIGKKGLFNGDIKRFGSRPEVHHPDVEFLPEGVSLQSHMASNPLTFGRILPVYPLTEGLSQKVARKIWHDITETYASCLMSPIPVDILEKYNLMPLPAAIQQAHWPTEKASLEELEEGRDQARRSIVFDEFFFLELGLALRRRGMILEEGIPFQVNHLYTKPLSGMLPFKLTAAQKRVLGEIKRDVMSPHPMNRLVQGDVGSGKTIVALMAALLAIENNTQVAVVAPTEILAEQHFFNFRPWLESLNLQVRLLSGSSSPTDRRILLDDLRSGRIHLLVGTHAVLQENVEFKRLGLGIIDEQHRFGVKQRAVLRKKGENPHILVMTATPIPRTLSLTLYGDLALSVIDEMPPGRTPVTTRLIPENHPKAAYDIISRELEAGRQAYIVYPLVEESEKSDLKAATEAAEHLATEIFPQHRIGLLHGRLKSDEKEAVMTAFKNQQIDILVSTTVIEVGIDVPNATVMLIEHAERFGLAQLHQLRGRVGRGAHRGYCLLVHSPRCTEDARQRLEVMVKTTDGFQIAEADLQIRGPGELMGTRQAGLPDFRVANLLRDGYLLEQARDEAFHLAEKKDFLSNPDYQELRQALMDRWGDRLELATVA